MIYVISWILSLIIIKRNFKRKVFGRENLPSKGAFILASNHASYIDPLVLGTALPCSKWLNYLAKKDLFEKPITAWYLKKIHAMPLDRNGDIAAIKTVVKLLKSGKSILLFPEGTRSRNGKLQSAKPGIGFIAAKASVPILPAYIEGSYEAMSAGIASIKKGSPINVFIGKPMHIDSIDSKDKYIYQRISDQIMEAISHLKDTYADKAS